MTNSRYTSVETSRPPRTVAVSPTRCTEALLYSIISAEVLIELRLRSWDRSWGRAIIDAMVRRTDTGYEPQYLPWATEEDHGAHPFKARAGIAALTFAAAR
jgi:hypothetical protein